MSDTQGSAAAGGRRGIRSVVVAVAGVAIAAVLLFALLHVFIRPIPPGQDAPAGHFGEPCVLCHLVSESAEPADVQ